MAICQAVSAGCHQLSTKEFYYSDAHIIRNEIKLRLTVNHLFILAQIVLKMYTFFQYLVCMPNNVGRHQMKMSNHPFRKMYDEG
jgi:hypothetical protein